MGNLNFITDLWEQEQSTITTHQQLTDDKITNRWRSDNVLSSQEGNQQAAAYKVYHWNVWFYYGDEKIFGKENLAKQVKSFHTCSPR